MNKWKVFEKTKPPKDICVLIKLEEKMLNTYYHTGIFYDKVAFIGGRFDSNCPKPELWIEIPKLNNNNE